MHRASPKHRQRTDWRASVEQATSQRDRDSTAVMHRASPRWGAQPTSPGAETFRRHIHLRLGTGCVTPSVIHRASPRASTTDPRVSVKQAMSWPDRNSTAVMHRASRVRVDLASIRWIDLTRAGVVYALGDARCIT